ncbi:MAG: hypothetical protein CL916_06645 [Deltaproteobacteria bacterium]|nr:hypothetical protein [Deltaproteobacteria bacterium]
MNNVKNLLLVGVLLSLTACASDYELKGKRPDVNPGDVTDCSFTPVSGTQVSAYDCNPVFTNTGENWGGDVGSIGFHVTEVLGHPFYQMWYTSSSSDSFGGISMGYAVSSNGTDWTPHPSNPLMSTDPSGWDKDSIAGQVVVWDPIDSQYVMAYQGFTLGTNEFDPGVWGLGIATSPDGKNWTKSARNPVINFTTDFDILFGGALIQPCWPLTITITERGALKGYIAAAKAEEAFLGMEAACHIYEMNGLDAETWIINDQRPVMEANGSYDTMGVASAAVVDFEGVLYMFYVGFTDWVQYTGYQSAQNLTLNLATSTDGGGTWTKDPNNPIPLNLTNPGEISDVGAQVVGSRILLWVTDNYEGENSVGYFYYEPNIESHQ